MAGLMSKICWMSKMGKMSKTHYRRSIINVKSCEKVRSSKRAIDADKGGR